ncbi:MAG: hypothetical protein ABI824_02480 [Acidobacteriota bacterium]
MKRKRATSSDAETQEIVVPQALLAQAKASLSSDRVVKPARCVVCSGDCAPGSSEGLCWVCRRLKTSAWRDADSQMPAQE